MDKFIAIDFETAHGKRYSACAIGIVVVENNQITERFHTLIQPPENKYFYKNIEIHGITPEMTKNTPTFDCLYPTIREYLNNNLVVSHNAAFDMDVLAKTMDFYGLVNDDLDFNCSCTFNIYGGGLKECCTEYNIPLNHHDPLSDAEACALLFMRLNSIPTNKCFDRFNEKYISRLSTADDYIAQQFYFKNEAVKAINTLKGILLGILMDKILNEKEIIELQKWSENKYYLIDHHPFKEFMQLITETTESDKFDLSTVEDMYWLCQRFENDNFQISLTSGIQVLQGIFHGILADGVIKDTEVFELEKWLSKNIHLSSIYPYDEIFRLTQSILKDGLIDEDERKRLKAFFYDFVDLANSEVNSQIKDEISNVPVSGICNSNPEIVFEGKLFCLTGTFVNGEKSFIEEKIQLVGGQTKSGLTKITDYLIVGSCGDPAWAYSCYGRKIEAALKNQKIGGKVLIVHEFDFWNIIQGYLN